jgi:hypothetical protein
MMGIQELEKNQATHITRLSAKDLEDIVGK